MNDMAPTITPKSDQLNADDLLAGPRTITIREVKIAPGTEQPVGVFFDGDGGKPYLPCKSMRRVMVAVWGPDASAYTGRSMTIYRDPTVTWGGMEVGGIRISHMSHIDKTMVIVLTATKKARKPFTVEPLVMKGRPAAQPKETPLERAQQLLSEVGAVETQEALDALSERVSKAVAYLPGIGMGELAEELGDEYRRQLQRLAGEEAAA